MIEDIVGVFGEQAAISDAPPADLRVKPALVTLLYNQAELLDSSVTDDGLDYDLRSGFPDRRRVIEWYQRAVVRSLGHIADRWQPSDCVKDAVLLKAMLSDDGTVTVGDDTMDAEAYRFLLEASIVQPAFDRAYRSIRDTATEYVKSDEKDGEWAERDLDPTKQSNVAMRPGFQALDDRQQRALDLLWGGFESTRGVVEWTHSVTSAANGEFDDGFERKVLGDNVAMQHLVEDRHTETARRYREAFATTHVLPMFVDGVQVAEAAELAKRASDSSVTLRMQGNE